MADALRAAAACLSEGLTRMVGVCTNRDVVYTKCDGMGAPSMTSRSGLADEQVGAPGVGSLVWQPLFLPVRGAASGFGVVVTIRTRYKMLHSKM